MKVCTHCHVSRADQSFKKETTGFTTQCLPCRLNNRKAYAVYQAKNQDKRKAHQAVRLAKRRKKIDIPKFCQITSCLKTRLQAHHWKGYAVKHYLNVQWFCHQHHKDQHIIR